TVLDYLGFGLQAPDPSIGELLQQGQTHWNKPWIIISVTTMLVAILVMITFIGESLREAFDPKKHSHFE
ncbi:MAG: ABC transporter permease, partial [Proteobacteria bacterium]|nr:ABC transporter permease [Pseudomonadota bacterium]